MAHMRKDDKQDKTYFRSADRVFNLNGRWYFSTREGEQGPFASERQAQFEIARFITEKTDLAHFQREREEASRKIPTAQVYTFKGRALASRRAAPVSGKEVLI